MKCFSCLALKYVPLNNCGWRLSYRNIAHIAFTSHIILCIENCKWTNSSKHRQKWLHRYKRKHLFTWDI